MNNVLQQLQDHASVLSPPLQAELLNYAIYLEQRANERNAPPVSDLKRRQRLAEALENAAALDPYREVKDPVAWQREQREDRPLPEREDAH